MHYYYCGCYVFLYFFVRHPRRSFYVKEKGKGGGGGGGGGTGKRSKDNAFPVYAMKAYTVEV